MQLHWFSCNLSVNRFHILMGQAQIVDNKITFDEYLNMEDQGEIRHEFYDGEVFAMAGTTMNHNEIVNNVRTLLKDFFRPQGCRVFDLNVNELYLPEGFQIYGNVQKVYQNQTGGVHGSRYPVHY